MTEMYLFCLILLPVCIGAGIGMSWIVSRYTDMGLFEPFFATVILVGIMAVSDFKGIASEWIAEMSVEADSGGLPVLILFLQLCLITGAFSLFMLFLTFAFYGFCAVFSKRCTGKLVRIENPKGKKVKFAFYRINGQEYQCAVAGASKKLVIGNEYKVRLNRIQKKVYDKGTILVCFVGLLAFFTMIGIFLLPYILV